MQGTSSTDIASDLLKAKVAGKAIVGFETALITHGLPRPLNLDVFREMTRICKENSAVPAAVAVIDGRLRIGLSDEEISRLACMEAPVKIGIRDLPFAISRDVTGGTTVSATLRACRMSGIRVMATGGIGGVHRGLPLDVSSDLIELSRSRAICVCSGPKSVLDVKVTYEILESWASPWRPMEQMSSPPFSAVLAG
jgi:pseudouridine-5'-phosphate glycosidase